MQIQYETKDRTGHNDATTDMILVIYRKIRLVLRKARYIVTCALQTLHQRVDRASTQARAVSAGAVRIYVFLGGLLV
jgi:hypothetical protein